MLFPHNHINFHCYIMFNPLRTVVAYMRQEINLITMRKQIDITSPPFTLQT